MAQTLLQRLSDSLCGHIKGPGWICLPTFCITVQDPEMAAQVTH